MATFRFLKFLLVGLLITGMAHSLSGQDPNQEPTSVAQLRKAYDSSIDKLRDLLKELKRTEALYLFSDSENSHQHKEDWEQIALDAESQFTAIRNDAFALFLAEEKPDEDLKLVVRNLVKGSMYLGQLGLSHRICEKLVDLNPEDESLTEALIRVNIFNNKFDDAAKFRSSNAEKIEEKFNQKEKILFNYVNTLKTNFDRELKLREKDKSANLPRVELKIKDKGSVILELFEDEAPETVANFISLIETGFYDGTIFHNVSNSFIAQGGLMSTKEIKRTGYKIYDECEKPERRHHFRGSISTWPSSLEKSDGKPNQCSAEFSIFRMPGPYFTDSNQTVFGRVIEGMEIIDEIQNTKTIDDEDGTETAIPDIVPDTIESFKVVRKRDHDYQPNPVK